MLERVEDVQDVHTSSEMNMIWLLMPFVLSLSLTLVFLGRLICLQASFFCYPPLLFLAISTSCHFSLLPLTHSVYAS